MLFLRHFERNNFLSEAKISKSTVKVTAIVVAILISAILLFPIQMRLGNGKAVVYKSIVGIYVVTCSDDALPEKVKILGITVFDK